MFDNVFDKKAFSEIIEILNHTDKQLVEKIPDSFIKFLFENMDKEYKVEINFFNENWDDTILEETKAILAFIYRDYIASAEERKDLLIEEKREREKQEMELREKYNPDNLFKNKHSEIPNELKENTQLIAIQQYPWYKRLYQKILAIFGIRNK